MSSGEASLQRGYALLLVLLVLAMLVFPLAAIMYILASNAKAASKLEGSFACESALAGAFDIIHTHAMAQITPLGTTATLAQVDAAALAGVCTTSPVPGGCTPTSGSP